MEITIRDHSIMAVSRYTYMDVVFHAHSYRGKSHIQRIGNGEAASTSPPFF